MNGIDELPVLDEREFAVLVEHERRCVYRNGHATSVVVFDLGSRERRAKTLDIVRAANRRMRTTDRLGWFNGGHIAALLPYTGSEGADVFAIAVNRAIAVEIPHRVMTFPDDQQNNGEEEPGQQSTEARLPIEDVMIPRWKRIMDVSGALFGLALAVPVIGLAACSIKVSSPGPVFFRQARAGLNGRRFICWKLRTMYDGAEHRQIDLLSSNEVCGPAFKMIRDPRVTPVGRWLRKLSIDELPQLWNVLRGDMSLVGPRPLPCHEAAGCTSWQRQRLDTKPGLTGLWQVSGRCAIPFDHWVRLDIRYVREHSLLRDVGILLRTIPAVLSGRGAY